jgi:2-haloacid dehalogenase
MVRGIATTGIAMHTLPRPNAVVFDIGNVLFEWNPVRFYDSIMPTADRVRMFAETGIEEMNLRIDAGAPFRETVYATAEAHPEWADKIIHWHDRWIEMAQPVIAGSVALLRALRAQGVPVFALSNFGDDSFAFAETQYDFLTEFDRRYISGRMGTIKPEAAIYAAVERDCGLPPETLLFTDDRPENIDAATARGWQGHLFDGPEGWAHRLVLAGLLPECDAARALAG